MRRLVVLTAAFAVVSGFILVQGIRQSDGRYAHPEGPAFRHTGFAGAWFQRAKPFCNPVEVDTWQRRNPPPETMEGTAYGAACYALAGHIERARELILQVDGDDRWRAAGIVFGVGHPVADAGDDLAAGPIMELVVEFWPNHYMALYHAGAANYQLARYDPAREYLEDFLEQYDVDDGWRRNAQLMLSELED